MTLSVTLVNVLCETVNNMTIEDLLNLYLIRDKGTVPDDVIKAFEQRHSIVLPQNYKSLIQAHNGPVFDHLYVDYLSPYSGDIVRTDVGFREFTEQQRSGSIQNINQDLSGLMAPDDIIIFGQDATGDFFAFDYANPELIDQPRIVLLLHDAVDDEGVLIVCKIAHTFDDFILQIYHYLDPEEIEYRERNR